MELLNIETGEGTFEAVSDDGEVEAYLDGERVADPELGETLFQAFASLVEKFAENAPDPFDVMSNVFDSMVDWSEGFFGESMEKLLKDASLRREGVIRKTPDKEEWCVYSKKGKNLGCYPSLSQAKKRLQQVEYFKHQGELKEAAKKEWSAEFSIQLVEAALRALAPQTPEQYQILRIARREISRFANQHRRSMVFDVHDYWPEAYYLREDDPSMGTLPSDHPPTAWSGTHAV